MFTRIMSLIVFAPNIYTGGGLVLLQSLVSAARDKQQTLLFADERAMSKLAIPAGVEVRTIGSSVISRIQAEWVIARQIGAGDQVLMLHGLPPLFSCKARVTLFSQNRLLVNRGSLSAYALNTRIRLYLKRVFSFVRRSRVDDYVVQTNTMKSLLQQWHGRPPNVRVLPFFERDARSAGHASVARCKGEKNLDARECTQKKWDYVYVSSVEGHKNHETLIEAWRLLARDQIFPSLALTIGDAAQSLQTQMRQSNAIDSTRIVDVGRMPHSAIMALYQQSSALIFPSLTESFGLPLLEASELGLPILAPELDYVRDVCHPAQTFDPTSAISIARSVRRHMNCIEPLLQVRTADEFLAEVVRASTAADRSAQTAE